MSSLSQNLPFTKDIADQVIIKTIPKGDFLVKEGQLSDELGFITSGYLRTFQIDYNGNDITTNFHGPNTYCASYYSFYSSQAAIENIIAITDIELHLVKYDNLMSLFEHSLESNIVARKIIEKVCIQKDFRIAQLLKLNGTDKYLWFLETYPDLIKVAQMNHISSFLGIKPETLSRIRRKIIS